MRMIDMNAEEERDMANTAIMLNEAVNKRVADAIMCLLDGTKEPVYSSPIQGDLYEGANMWTIRADIAQAIVECAKPVLQNLIRQEIVNAFSPTTGCTKVVNVGDTIHLETSMIVR